MSFAFTPENQKHIETICARYPVDRRQSALLPVLDIAQRQNGGWLSHPVLEAVADVIQIPVLKVYEVASFYTMYQLKPVGKYHIQWCGTTPCWLRGAADVAHACRKHLGLEDSGHSIAITGDGLFSMQEVECLGACANAPIIQINDDFFEDLDETSAVALLKTCKEKGLPKPYSAKKRLSSEPEGMVLDVVKTPTTKAAPKKSSPKPRTSKTGGDDVASK